MRAPFAQFAPAFDVAAGFVRRAGANKRAEGHPFCGPRERCGVCKAQVQGLRFAFAGLRGHFIEKELENGLNVSGFESCAAFSETAVVGSLSVRLLINFFAQAQGPVFMVQQIAQKAQKNQFAGQASLILASTLCVNASGSSRAAGNSFSLCSRGIIMT